MKATCVMASAPNRLEVRRCDIRDPEPRELVIETLYSAVSPGTELRCQRGDEPNAGPFPMITGYSIAGKVIRGHGEVEKGDLVFCAGSGVLPRGVSRAWGGHISRVIAGASSVVKISPAADPVSVSALAMLSIALRGVARTRPAPGDRVLVVGLGLIGQMATALFRLAGCRVAVCDPIESRRILAAPHGAPAYAPDDGWHDRARRDFPDGFDILADASGNADALYTNSFLLRDKSWEDLSDSSPKALLLANYPGDVRFEFQNILFNRELEIVTSRNYVPQDLRQAARLIENGEIDLKPLLKNLIPVNEAPRAFQALREQPDENLTVVFDWRESQ